MGILKCGQCKYNHRGKGIEFSREKRNMCAYEPPGGFDAVSISLLEASIQTTDETECLYEFTAETLPEMVERTGDKSILEGKDF
jgi:hypothetical protein